MLLEVEFRRLVYVCVCSFGKLEQLAIKVHSDNTLDDKL